MCTMFLMIMITMTKLMKMGREEEDEDHPAVDLKGFTKVHQSHHDHQYEIYHDGHHDHQYENYHDGHHDHPNSPKVLSGVAEGPIPGMQVLRSKICFKCDDDDE